MTPYFSLSGQYHIPFYFPNSYYGTFFNAGFDSFLADVLIVQEPLHNPAPIVVTQNIPATEPATPSCKRPACTPGLVGTNAAFLVQDHI